MEASQNEAPPGSDDPDPSSYVVFWGTLLFLVTSWIVRLEERAGFERADASVLRIAGSVLLV
jgi:hypothetical protein